MIRGYKPNGYSVSFTKEGKKIEAETRQCVHCQYMWSYGDPHQDNIDLLGYETRRGYCVSCGGFICCRDSCIFKQQQLVKDYLYETGKVRNCIPFEEWNNRIRDKVEKLLPLDPDLTITESGLLVAKKFSSKIII